MRDYSIGILGVASYATSDLFSRLIDAFPAEKEWDRPRIVIDNYCTIPSRVRAILYGENEGLVIEKMCEAMKTLVDANVTRIIVDCNTAHYYVPEVVDRVKGAKEKVIHIIDTAADFIKSEFGNVNVGLVASEGVLETKIYNNRFDGFGVGVDLPEKKDYKTIRSFIEAVKQNQIDDCIISDFVSYINSFKEDCVVLGCTELPVLYKYAKERNCEINKNIIDPLEEVIKIVAEEYYKSPIIEF